MFQEVSQHNNYCFCSTRYYLCIFHHILQHNSNWLTLIIRTGFHHRVMYTILCSVRRTMKNILTSFNCDCLLLIQKKVGGRRPNQIKSVTLPHSVIYVLLLSYKRSRTQVQTFLFELNKSWIQYDGTLNKNIKIQHLCHNDSPQHMWKAIMFLCLAVSSTQFFFFQVFWRFTSS